MAADVRCW